MTNETIHDPHEIAAKLDFASDFAAMNGSTHYAGVCAIAAGMLRELVDQVEVLRRCEMCDRRTGEEVTETLVCVQCWNTLALNRDQLRAENGRLLRIEQVARHLAEDACTRDDDTVEVPMAAMQRLEALFLGPEEERDRYLADEATAIAQETGQYGEASVPVRRLREIADAHFQKSVDITVNGGSGGARHASMSAILYSLAEEAEGAVQEGRHE